MVYSVPRQMRRVKPYEYEGVIHVHSSESDGRGSIPKIMRAANRAHLDYLILTDHNLLRLESEGYYGGCLLLVGEEITPGDDVNHYLAFGIAETVRPHGKTPQQFIDEVNSQGGFGVIAHPYSRPNPSLWSHGYPWIDWHVTGFTGVSIWNYILDGDVGLTRWNLGYYLLFPTSYVDSPREETVRQWDEINQKRKVVGIGSADSHGILISHRVCFRFIRTHVLLTEPLRRDLDRDKHLILSAIRRGRCFVANDATKSSRGFAFVARRGGETCVMGESLDFSGTVDLEIYSPEESEICLIRNGKKITASFGKAAKHTAQAPGVYRVEAFIQHRGKRRPWVLTNPIYLTS